MFLSSNGLVKIGDFGISKILDKTQENAETVVGTPYYLSPEICQNIPYDYKSDVWSLGCILYELCTLKHPFLSQNLLGLVNKIVNEKPEAIPSVYSEGLSRLVDCLLEKDMEKRLGIDEILELNFVKTLLSTFLESGNDVVEVFDDFVTDDVFMTPREKMKMKKILKAKKRENEINSFLKNSKVFDLKQKKREQMSSFLGRNKKKKLSVSETEKKINYVRRKSYNSSFFLEDDLKKSKKFGQITKFDNDTLTSFELIEKEVYKKKLKNQYQYTNYDFTNNSIYKKFDENKKKIKNENSNFKKKKISEDEFSSDFENLEEVISENEKNENLENFDPKKKRVKKFKEKLSLKIGPNLFDKMYDFLLEEHKKNTPQKIVKNKVMRNFGKENLSHCFDIDQLLFMEKY